MGLDQYLRAKTSIVEQKSSRGACGGLFPLAPKDNGTTEIGYWRKAYAVSDYLRDLLFIDGEFNLEDEPLDYFEVLEVIDHATNLLQEDEFDDPYEKMDWEDVKVAFTKAKYILENDPSAEIFYMEWY